MMHHRRKRELTTSNHACMLLVALSIKRERRATLAHTFRVNRKSSSHARVVDISVSVVADCSQDRYEGLRRSTSTMSAACAFFVHVTR